MRKNDVSITQEQPSRSLHAEYPQQGAPLAHTPGLGKPTWKIDRSRGTLRIGYGRLRDYPQYAVLHLKSSYLRAVYARHAGWGTSCILMPAFWTEQRYYQGAPVEVQTTIDEPDLLLAFRGTIGGLRVNGEIRLNPPQNRELAARVSVFTQGTVNLADRPDDAFKPAMLSSMHVSTDRWDAAWAFADGERMPFPENGPLDTPGNPVRRWGVEGGSCRWKRAAPRVEVTMDRPRPVNGWCTKSENPNHDNVGVWAVTSHVLESWHCRLRFLPAQHAP